MSRLHAASSFAVWVLLASPSTHAQPQSPASTSQADCASNAPCLALYEQAQQQLNSGQRAEALRSFKLAYEVHADPRLLFSIARLMQLQGQEIEAVPYYRSFVESGLDDESQKAKARTYLAECESVAAEAEAKRIAMEKEAEAERLRNLIKKQQTEAPKPVPVYKKGWFWAVVGGSAAAVGLGIGLGVGISNQGPKLPDGVNIYAAMF